MREPTPTWTTTVARPARMTLESLKAPMRAMAREEADNELLLEAVLPWLTLGTEVATEIEPGRVQIGRVRWVGLDVTRKGAARLRILVAPDGAPVRTSLPKPESWAPRDDQPPPRSRRTGAFIFGAALLTTLLGAYFGWPRSAPEFLRVSDPAALPTTLRVPSTATAIPPAPVAAPDPVVRRRPKKLAAFKAVLSPPVLTVAKPPALSLFGPPPRPIARLNKR